MQSSNTTERYKRQKKLSSRMETNLYTTEEINGVISLLNELTGRGVNNLERFQAKLLSSIPKQEQFWDIILEGKIALFLALNDFVITFYPCGPKGVDLKISYLDYLLFVEISRFREDCDTKEKLEKVDDIGETELLVPYGRGEKDVDAFHSKILDEAAQLPEGDMGLVILRSDNCRIEEFEYEQAVEYLEEQVLQNDTLRRMSGVLFDSGQVLLSNGKRFYLWCNPRANRRIDDELHKKLGTLLPNNFIA